MAFVEILWDLDDDESGNVRHIAEHGSLSRLSKSSHDREELEEDSETEISFPEAESERDIQVQKDSGRGRT